MVLIMAGCTQNIEDHHLANTNMVLNTVVVTPSNTVRVSPSGTVLPTVLFLTMTTQADSRRDRYLLPSDIDEEIANVIQLALEKRLSPTAYRGKRFFSYVLLKPPEETEDGVIKAFLFVENRVFYVDRGELKEGGGGDIPAVVIMEKKENGWRVEVQTPVPGEWGSSIREIFPEELLPLIFHSPPIPYEAIEKNIIQQAEEHFGLAFYAAKNSFPPKYNTATPALRILTLTPTPTLDISTLELDVSGRMYIGDEYVSIAVDLYPKVARPFYKGVLSSGWQVYIYRRRANEDDSTQNALVLDEPKEADGRYEFSVKVPLDEILTRFGDSRGFMYQIVDDADEVFFQDEFYIQHGLNTQYQGDSKKTFPDGYPDYVNEGLIIGFPNLLSNNISPVFLTNEGAITVQEPRGGFYRLHFEYNFATATGITGTDELRTLSKNLLIELFPCQENGFCNDQEAIVLSGVISGVSGILQASFPHEWLDQERDDAQTFCLRIADKDNNVYKEVYLHFIPYTP